ncbi:alpha/beta fold hydrolase [Actinomadura sp. 3N407]|uniref:alpha/beta fold hydrolase n=1 Tax=Actinomadura sp. 3N407 TaxID=3457423 RepID=UPI003FCEAE37
MPFTAVGPDKVHYEIDGEGPGLVLVHGAGGDAAKVFGGAVPHFADSRTVIRPNLSGSGQTTDDGGPLSIERLAGQVVAAAKSAADGPVDLLGFSMGACVAAAVAATNPELVHRLILMGGTTHTTDPRDRFNFAFWQDLLTADFALFERFALLQGFSPAMLDTFGHDGLAASLGAEWPPGLRRQVALATGLDIRDLLPMIQAPTLVIGFGGDQMLPIKNARELHEAIPGSDFVEIPDWGHMDFLVRPDLIVPQVHRFLGSETSHPLDETTA